MTRNDRLVYDVGLHTGEDTEFYLKKGYSVVAFEANPSLAEACRVRFSKHIQTGQLHIVQGAIAPPTSTGRVKFYVNNKTSIWGTIDEAWVARNTAWGSESTEIEVDQINMTKIFEEFGIPHYLKIDIEGADSLVLNTLNDCQDRPQFISIEVNGVDVTASLQDLNTLGDLGYKQFQLVPQQNIGGTVVDTTTLRGEPLVHIFAEGASGAFGDDLSGVSVDRDAVIASLSPPVNSWQDIHACISESQTVNVALNRPATQSSTSPWSTDPSPDVDARVANNGDVASDRFFHTDFEECPWWQVDLGEPFILDKIVIYNRIDQMDRLKRFTIFGSPNGQHWSAIHKKYDDASFSVFATNITACDATRFVRLRLDGRGCLHFREMQVFGRTASVGR